MERLSDEDVLRIGPMLLCSIHWKKAVGRPAGDLCSGFRVVVDERTPSQFRVGPSGPEKIPGTGEWRLLTNSAPCAPAPDAAGTHVLTFNVPNVHLNVFDGKYRVTPQLIGNWDNSLIRYLVGPLFIEPISWHVVLTTDNPIATVEFDVLRRPWFRFR
jgi:hypothetical protein